MITLIRNVQVLKDDELVSSSIVIDGKLISEISCDGNLKIKSDKIIDGKNLVALSGLIDVHVHLREPGLTHKEDFLSGSMAAAAGGVTTVLDMPNTNPPTTTVKALEEKRELAKKSIVNYGFYFGATSENIDELLKARNIKSVKIYMGSSTGNLLLKDSEFVENVFRRWNGIITVHAEDENCLEQQKGKFPMKTENHGKFRPRECAVIALKKVILFARKYKRHLHIAHISTKEEVDIIKSAKKSGINISCEVTPHHLFLSENDLKNLGNFGKMNPPLREKADCDALWSELGKTIDIVATDHAPHTKEEKLEPYTEAPSGVAGLETTLPLLLDAYNKKKIDLRTLIKVTSENPAKVFGIKNKGFLREGFDADIVLVEIGKVREVKDSELFTKCKWSPFNSWKLKGYPVMTFVNGNLIYSNGMPFEITENNKINAQEVDYNE